MLARPLSPGTCRYRARVRACGRARAAATEGVPVRSVFPGIAFVRSASEGVPVIAFVRSASEGVPVPDTVPDPVPVHQRPARPREGGKKGRREEEGKKGRRREEGKKKGRREEEE